MAAGLRTENWLQAVAGLGGASMNEQTGSVQAAGPKRRGRGALLWLARIVLVILGLAVIGTILESRTEAADIRSYPPPGQMVDVGGYRLHINCTGAGSPTVVIDAGLADWSASWSAVQLNVAPTTRVCTYDRAGYGWSDAGPLPRTSQQFVKELHALLTNANIAGPYVLVGHSLGGFTMRVYAHEYPVGVAGIVLIDSMSPSQMKPSATATTTQAAAPSGVSVLPALVARTGLARLLGSPLGANSPLPAQAEQAYNALSVTPKHVQTLLDEAQGMAEGGRQAAAVTTFGDLPLIVLTRGLNLEPDWPAEQADLLTLSSHSKQLIADKSDHLIQLGQPEAAVAAIVDMVEQVRQAKSK
jgi:pimeloyl-ACP methyl ester carboxylesterase